MRIILEMHMATLSLDELLEIIDDMDRIIELNDATNHPKPGESRRLEFTANQAGVAQCSSY